MLERGLVLELRRAHLLLLLSGCCSTMLRHLRAFFIFFIIIVFALSIEIGWTLVFVGSSILQKCQRAA